MVKIRFFVLASGAEKESGFYAGGNINEKIRKEEYVFMLVSMYKRLLTIFFIVSLVLLLGGIFLTILCLKQNVSFEEIGINQQQYWWFFYSQNNHQLHDELWPLMGILLFSGLSLGVSLYLRMIYRKTASLEVFFFTLFLFFVSFENFRILVFYLNLLKNPVVINLIISRVLYFGRFGCLLSLLFSSLFAVELKFHKIGVIVWIITGLSFLLAYIVPLDGTVYLAQMVYRLNDEKGVFILVMLIYVFILLNWIVAYIMKNNRYFLVLLSSVLFLLGREFMLFTISPLMLMLSLLAFFLGILQFSRQLDKLYIWGK